MLTIGLPLNIMASIGPGTFETASVVCRIIRRVRIVGGFNLGEKKLHGQLEYIKVQDLDPEIGTEAPYTGLVEM